MSLAVDIKTHYEPRTRRYSILSAFDEGDIIRAVNMREVVKEAQLIMSEKIAELMFIRIEKDLTESLERTIRNESPTVS